VTNSPIRFTYTVQQWPLLDKARANWASERARLDGVGATESERAALVPALRRKAVLDAANESPVLHWLFTVLAVVLLLVMPAALTYLTGGRMSAGHLALVYVWYIPSLPLAVVLLIFALLAPPLLALPLLRRGVPEWLGYPISLAMIGGTTAGTVLWFNHLRHSDSTFLLSLFAAIAFIVLTLVALSSGNPSAAARRRRETGVLGLDHTAGLVLFDAWEVLSGHRRDWRTAKARRDLHAQLFQLAAKARVRLDQPVRANTADDAARQWAHRLAWQLSQTVRDHGHRLLRIHGQHQYDDVVAAVRIQTVELCGGSWTSTERDGEPEPHATLAKRLSRLVVPLVLVGAAVAVGYIPGLHLEPDNLFTVRLSLVVPAVLSLLPLGPGQDAVASAMRDAISRMKS
jgi:hypothetical protein